MEVRIGIRDIAREISIETDAKPEDLKSAVEKAVTSGSVLTLTDDKGRQILVPGNVIGFVDLGPSEARKVGFGNA